MIAKAFGFKCLDLWQNGEKKKKRTEPLNMMLDGSAIF